MQGDFSKRQIVWIFVIVAIAIIVFALSLFIFAPTQQEKGWEPGRTGGDWSSLCLHLAA